MCYVMLTPSGKFPIPTKNIKLACSVMSVSVVPTNIPFSGQSVDIQSEPT